MELTAALEGARLEEVFKHAPLPLRGVLAGSFELEGRGATPVELVRALAGAGTARLTGARLPALVLAGCAGADDHYCLG